jgi:hypothetical protein
MDRQVIDQKSLDMNKLLRKLILEGKSSTAEPAITKNYFQQLRKRVVSYQKPPQ